MSPVYARAILARYNPARSHCRLDRRRRRRRVCGIHLAPLMDDERRRRRRVPDEHDNADKASLTRSQMTRTRWRTKAHADRLQWARARAYVGQSLVCTRFARLLAQLLGAAKSAAPIIDQRHCHWQRRLCWPAHTMFSSTHMNKNKAQNKRPTITSKRRSRSTSSFNVSATHTHLSCAKQPTQTRNDS